MAVLALSSSFFYAGIMAIMIQSGLAASLSEWLVSLPVPGRCPSGHSSCRRREHIRPSGGTMGGTKPSCNRGCSTIDVDLARNHAMAVAWGMPD